MSLIVVLRAGESNNDVYLRSELAPSIDIYLYRHGENNDVYLRPLYRPYDVISNVSLPFPTQYSGLRYYDGTIKELSLVAIADAPSGVGGVLKINKNGVDYSAYIVDITDPNASKIRIKTSTSIKSLRLKT